MKQLVVLMAVASLVMPAMAGPIAGTYDLGGSWNEAFNGWEPLPKPGDIGNNVLYAGGFAWSAYGTLTSVELLSSSGNTYVYESVYAADAGYSNVNLNYGGDWSPGNLTNYQGTIDAITVITTKVYDGTPLQDESNLTNLSFVASGSGLVTVSYPQGGSEMVPVTGVSISFVATSTGLPTFGYWEPDVLMDMSGAFDSAELTIVPEPVTLAILGLGGLFLRRRIA